MQPPPALRLEAALSRTETDRSRPLPLELTLVNRSGESVLINRRLAPGYRDSLSRELFVDVVDADDGTPAPVADVDYERAFPGPEEYVELAPGESVSTRFDLLEWYRPQHPGRFRVVVHYQADEPAARPPEAVERGVVSSAPLALEITA